MMKKILPTILFCFSLYIHAQGYDQRLQNIQSQLELLAVDAPGLNEDLKIDINVNDVTLTNFLLAVSKVHQVNISVAPELDSIMVINNFSNVIITDLLVFLCKQYELSIDFTGNIMYIYPIERILDERTYEDIEVAFEPLNQLLTIDLKNDTLGTAFRKIMDLSGAHLMYNVGMENILLTAYLKEVPIDVAMKNLAFSNGLIFEKSRDGFYLFSIPYQENTEEIIDDEQLVIPQGLQRKRQLVKSSDFYYKVLDSTKQELMVNFENASIADMVNEIGYDLNLNIYTSSSLDQAGTISFKAKRITFDKLLEKAFETTSQATPVTAYSNDNTQTINQQRAPIEVDHFTYKKEEGIYFFGRADHWSVRKTEIIPLMHRSVELLGNPSTQVRTNKVGKTVNGNVNYYNGGSTIGNSAYNNISNYSTTNIRTETSNRTSKMIDPLINILPEEVKADLDIKIDFELNSFLVSGPASSVKRFKSFVEKIDKPIPVVLIEVMILEINHSATIETGMQVGIGDAPVKTEGNIFPEANITFGAETINKVIGGFGDIGSINFGQVVPNFYASIKALETNGNIKIRSTPRLSTLNGHRANLAIGETTYYVVTNQNYYGSQIPQSSEIRNYQPINAELAVGIKPLVSGDGQITLDINVIQSNFSSERIEDDAPPGINSREFSSIIRVRDQDLVILGGLEEKVKNDSGVGVPILSKIPIIKWFFSSRKREDNKKKLTILIKPTVIY